MAVRYDKNFMAEINRTINAYNRKITRLGKVGGYTLPKKFTDADLDYLKYISASRKDVRRKLKDLQSFTARGGEKNIQVGKATIPKYQYVNIKRYQRLLSYQTTRKLNKYKTTHPISGGKEEPFTFAQYGSQEYLTMKARREALLGKNIEEMTSNDIKKYLEQLEANTRTKRDDLWQENYIKILEDTALSYGYDTEKLETIVEKLKKLKANDFSDVSFINRNIKAIIYYYKLLESIQTKKELSDVGEDVIRNLDEIYDYIDEILAKYE